jgi:hypothetical protein
MKLLSLALLLFPAIADAAEPRKPNISSSSATTSPKATSAATDRI